MKRYVIGNWKSLMLGEEARRWFGEFARLYRPIPGLEVIIAPSFICLQPLSQLIPALDLEQVKLAAQDISPFPLGAYTGAVAADMIKDMVDYVIIGHSERRRYFRETSQDTGNKLIETVDAGLTPIVCIDSPYTMSQLTALNDVDTPEMILAYGPVEANSVRVPEQPAKVAEAAAFIARIHPNRPVVYGGALNPGNVGHYALLPGLSGVFVGEASLDPASFVTICEQVGNG